MMDVMPTSSPGRSLTNNQIGDTGASSLGKDLAGNTALKMMQYVRAWLYVHHGYHVAISLCEVQSFLSSLMQCLCESLCHPCWLLCLFIDYMLFLQFTGICIRVFLGLGFGYPNPKFFFLFFVRVRKRRIYKTLLHLIV